MTFAAYGRDSAAQGAVINNSLCAENTRACIRIYIQTSLDWPIIKTTFNLYINKSAPPTILDFSPGVCSLDKSTDTFEHDKVQIHVYIQQDETKTRIYLSHISNKTKRLEQNLIRRVHGHRHCWTAYVKTKQNKKKH